MGELAAGDEMMISRDLPSMNNGSLARSLSFLQPSHRLSSEARWCNGPSRPRMAAGHESKMELEYQCFERGMRRSLRADRDDVFGRTSEASRLESSATLEHRGKLGKEERG